MSLAGEVPRRSEVAELVDAIGELDGVVAVHHQLTFRADDIAGQIERPIL